MPDPSRALTTPSLTTVIVMEDFDQKFMANPRIWSGRSISTTTFPVEDSLFNPDGVDNLVVVVTK